MEQIRAHLTHVDGITPCIARLDQRPSTLLAQHAEGLRGHGADEGIGAPDILQGRQTRITPLLVQGKALVHTLQIAQLLAVGGNHALVSILPQKWSRRPRKDSLPKPQVN